MTDTLCIQHLHKHRTKVSDLCCPSQGTRGGSCLSHVTPGNMRRSLDAPLRSPDMISALWLAQFVHIMHHSMEPICLFTLLQEMCSLQLIFHYNTHVM